MHFLFHRKFLYYSEREDERMKNSHRIRLLEDRLNRLEANDRNNFGICRKK